MNIGNKFHDYRIDYWSQFFAKKFYSENEANFEEQLHEEIVSENTE